MISPSPLASSARRILRQDDPFATGDFRNWTEHGLWPAKWITVPNAPRKFVAAYKLDFSIEAQQQCVVHVSADERYELFLNGERIGLGPERGDGNCWFFESYELQLPIGDHTIVARVWSLGDGAPFAQMSVRHGFLLCPEDKDLSALLATGEVPWLGKILNGYEFISSLSAEVTGENVRIDGTVYDWGHEAGVGENWSSVEVGASGVRAGTLPNVRTHHQMAPAMLPPMIDEERTGFRVRHVAATPTPTSDVPVCAADSIADEVLQWQAMLVGDATISITPFTSRRVIIDLEEYYCAWPEIAVSGGLGARLRVHWSEGLFKSLQTWEKGNRNDLEGKFFAVHGYNDALYGYYEDGPGDEFLPDGGEDRCFRPLWWQAGRYVEIHIQTTGEPLEIKSFRLRETRYPLEMESSFSCDDPQLEKLVPIMVRSLQMCAHETYMDCPFYEQLMYVGDTRIEALLTYVLTGDDRLPRKALRMFDASRINNGLTLSHYPTRYRQVIPPFSLWWVAMCHDYALWRDDADFVRSLLPGVRTVCDYFASLQNSDGLITAPAGWNFTDWVTGSDGKGAWPDGVPPDAAYGISGVLNWHAASTFKLAAELEEWSGEAEIATLQTRRAQTTAKAVDHFFWNEECGLYADDLAHENWSEHTQCLALLSGLMPEEKVARVGEGLITAPDLARTTFYFSYYLFEAYRVLGRMNALFERLNDWQVLIDDGLKTTIEQPEPTRSDCHAWGAHPLFHFYATLAGIRPAAPGFAKVRIFPQPGHLENFEVRMPHPQGEITLQWRDGMTRVTLPAGVAQV